MTNLKYKSLFSPHRNWINEQNVPNLLSSSDGYICSDVDLVWANRNNQKIMLLEEKCKMAEPSNSQSKLLKFVDNALKQSPKYYGLHLVQFEKERPDDGGKIFLDGEEITKEEYLKFLQFKADKRFYENSWFR